MLEGPFGEYTGYRSDPRDLRYVYRINAITYRNNPILTMSCMGTPVTSDTVVRSMDYEIFLKRILKMNGIPFTDVHVPLDSATMMAIVGVKPAYRGIANQVGYAFAAAKMGVYKIIVVEDDVDVFNLPEVWHALSSKCHPVRGIRVYDEAIDPSGLNPFMSPEERKWHMGAKVVFDCTWPLEWEGAVPGRVSFNEMYPREIQEKVIRNWANYGLD